MAMDASAVENYLVVPFDVAIVFRALPDRHSTPTKFSGPNLNTATVVGWPCCSFPSMRGLMAV